MQSTNFVRLGDLHRVNIPKHIADLAAIQEYAKMLDVLDTKVNENFKFLSKEAAFPNADVLKTLVAVAAAQKINKIGASIIDGSQAFILSKHQQQLKTLSNVYVMSPEEVYLSKALLLLGFNFEDLIDQNSPEEKPLIINESKRIQQIVFDVYKDNHTLFTIEPRVFEELIAELLYHQGFKVELTRRTRDGGYDILALRHIDKHIPIKFLVECKRYALARRVGVGIIRSFKEVIETEGANRGMIVTTSYFSKPAIKKQEEIAYKLDLRDKDDVMAWVHDYYKSFKSDKFI